MDSSSHRKRDAASPLESCSKLQKNTVSSAHSAHPSVLAASDLVSTPVSSKHISTTLTGKTLALVMGDETVPPDCSELLVLYKALEARVKNLELHLQAKDTELLGVRSENADLQRQIASLEAANTDASQSSQSLTGLTGPSELSGVTPSTSELSGVTPSPSPTSEHMESSDRDEVSPLNPNDIKRSKRLSLILNTFKNLPDHVNTVILGDSNTHSVRGKDVDRKGNKVCVRSFGGLCIYAAAYALKQYDKHSYGNIKKVIWSLGVNDAVHGGSEHCSDDAGKHIHSLYHESKKIFPNAQVGLILPFLGVKAVTPTYRKELERQLKSHAPLMKLHYQPNMSNMTAKDGLHLNREGKQKYINFLINRFTNNKPNTAVAPPVTKPSAPATQQQNTSSSGSLNRDNWESFRLPSSLLDDNRAEYRGFSEQLTRGLSDVVCRAMQSWSSQQRRMQNLPYEQWPPL